MACFPWLPHVCIPSIIDRIRTIDLHTRYSFAYATMGHRLPTILGKAIDDVIETLNQESEEDRVVDLVQCIERMDKLKEDLQAHARLRPIIDDGEADVALWNKEIAKYFQGMWSSTFVQETRSRAPSCPKRVVVLPFEDGLRSNSLGTTSLANKVSRQARTS